MIKNLDTPVLDLDGEPMKEFVKGAVRETTVKHFAVSSLALMNGDQISGEEKVFRYRLALRLNDGGQQDLSPEELSLIKKVVGASFAPLIVGQIFTWADS